MRLGTKLLVVFLLLAVLPLTWVTVHSYNSSIAAFRKAVEAESGGLAEEMGGRMEMMRRELAFRVERLARFPFPQLMATKDAKVDSQSNPLMAELMSEIGDAAPFVDAIEFRTSHPALPPVPGTVPALPPPPPKAAGPTSGIEPQRLVIQLSPEIPPAPARSQPGIPGAAPQGPTMRFRANPAARHSQRFSAPVKRGRKAEIAAEAQADN